MYTQCSNCRAIFRVTMKELTAAQGLLRCGECDTIFDAMKALSTTLPEERLISTNSANPPLNPAHKPSLWGRLSSTLNLKGSRNPKNPAPKANATPKPKPDTKSPASASLPARREKTRSNWWLGASLTCLGLLLLLQLVYSSRQWLSQQPLTEPAVSALCSIINCHLEQRDLKSIKMLSRNVFSHPNSPDILIIKASVQNEASFPQRYPYVEISFLNNASEVVALRRFKPEEYLDATTDPMMQPFKPRELSLNIKDPGADAVRFQFRFL